MPYGRIPHGAGVAAGLKMDALPAHWSFAAAQAIAALRKLVESFEFASLAGGHPYAAIDPDHLLEVFDGFLMEPAGMLFGGDRAELERLRGVFVGRCRPAYDAGHAAGLQEWRAGNQNLPPADLHQRAQNLAPDAPAARGWFAQGFCFAYAQAQFDAAAAGETRAGR